MGAGKSTIGRQLATRMNCEFFDTDHVVEDRTGADIPWIFDVEGEQGFRSRETAVLSELLKKKRIVLATGGGIVVSGQNRAMLQVEKQVVYLEASADRLAERTYKDKKRPLLQVKNPREKIIELIRQRDPLYREVASYIVSTDGKGPKNVVQEIIGLM